MLIRRHNLVAAHREAGIVLPSYIGAMVVAAALRNIVDHPGWLRLSQTHISAIGNISLYLFIVMALIALDIWQLTALAVPVWFHARHHWANAVASMDEIARKHGAARKAFLAVPVTGAFLIDFTNALLTTAMASMMTP